MCSAPKVAASRMQGHHKAHCCMQTLTSLLTQTRLTAPDCALSALAPLKVGVSMMCGL